MLVGACYASVHDHDDHAGEFSGDCAVCSTLPLSAEKHAADNSLIVCPVWLNLEAALIDVAFRVFPYSISPGFVRGPPLSISFS